MAKQGESLKEGDAAPDFSLPADDGSTVRLSDLRGSKVILYFYPKDDTSGCTRQACDLRDNLPQIEAEGAVVLGVSPDPVDSHEKFRDKYDLNFPLLADEDHQVCEAYGVWKEKQMFGNRYMGVERSTFVIDEEGKLSTIWRRVRPKGHAEKVLSEL
jgi:thioredoxin-dependent peroxiredoxin